MVLEEGGTAFDADTVGDLTADAFDVFTFRLTQYLQAGRTVGWWHGQGRSHQRH